MQQRLCKSKSRSLSDGESCFGEDFAQDFLRAHNEYRVRHGVHPLKLSKKVSYRKEKFKSILKRVSFRLVCLTILLEWAENVFFFNYFEVSKSYVMPKKLIDAPCDCS